MSFMRQRQDVPGQGNMANFRNHDDLRQDDESQDKPDTGLDILFNALSDSAPFDAASEILNGVLLCEDINLRQEFPEWSGQEYVGKKPSALHVAAQFSGPEQIRLLLDHGADVNARDEQGLTPLRVAVLQDKTDVAQALLATGATLDSDLLHVAVEHCGAEMIRVLIAGKAAINTVDDQGATPLHLAVSEGRLTHVHALIDAGANVNAVDGSGATPLHLLFGDKYIKYQESLARLLIARGADIDSIGNRQGKTVRDLIKEEGDEKLQAFVTRQVVVNQSIAKTVTTSNLERLDKILGAQGTRRKGGSAS